MVLDQSQAEKAEEEFRAAIERKKNEREHTAKRQERELAEIAKKVAAAKQGSFSGQTAALVVRVLSPRPPNKVTLRARARHNQHHRLPLRLPPSLSKRALSALAPPPSPKSGARGRRGEAGRGQGGEAAPGQRGRCQEAR